MSGDNSAPDKLPQIDRKVCDAQIHLPGEGYRCVQQPHSRTCQRAMRETKD
jgi:hypothetical protein